MSVDHIHDCTGSDMTCPCGYKMTFLPISVAIEIFDGDKALILECFSTSDIDGAIEALRDAADKLEREN